MDFDLFTPSTRPGTLTVVS